MLEALTDFIGEHQLCSPSDRLILTVSGGIDSVTMAQLMVDAGYSCAIAHCNFQLRGSESDADEVFVQNLAHELKVPVHVKRFDLTPVMQARGISVQMAAREERYSWFNQLLKDTGFDRIVTGHNLDDSVETFFINLSRGTGIRGLSGIPVQNGAVIRPFLFASREEISRYAGERRLPHRTDASNLQSKYARNRIRHMLIPVMKELNPSFLATMKQNMRTLSEVAQLHSTFVDRVRSEVMKPRPDGFEIPVDSLKSLAPRSTWLYELFSPFGFTRSQCEGVGHMLVAGTGKQSHSLSHTLYRDREKLILIQSGNRAEGPYMLQLPEQESRLPVPMDVERIERRDLEKVPEDPRTACLDMELLRFPLIVRRWRAGDFFYPLGMDRKKKLSDFFVDQKIPLPEKRRLWILTSGEDVIWIPGYRIDQRYRITDKTSIVLFLRLQTDIFPESAEKGL